MGELVEAEEPPDVPYDDMKFVDDGMILVSYHDDDGTYYTELYERVDVVKEVEDDE